MYKKADTLSRNINDKTIPERDTEVRDFNVTLVASAITRRRHLVIDTHRTDLGVMRQGYHHIHEMIVTANRLGTCLLLASGDMITQRINAYLARAKRATVNVGKHLGMGAPKLLQEKACQTSGGKRVTDFCWTETQENSS